jgi:hypothetical protein
MFNFVVFFPVLTRVLDILIQARCRRRLYFCDGLLTVYWWLFMDVSGERIEYTFKVISISKRNLFVWKLDP